jgi:hypothetical protein
VSWEEERKRKVWAFSVTRSTLPYKRPACHSHRAEWPRQLLGTRSGSRPSLFTSSDSVGRARRSHLTNGELGFLALLAAECSPAPWRLLSDRPSTTYSFACNSCSHHVWYRRSAEDFERCMHFHVAVAGGRNGLNTYGVELGEWPIIEFGCSLCTLAQ